MGNIANEVKLTDGIVDVYSRAIEELEEDVFLKYVQDYSQKVDASLLNGLRPIRKNIPILRRRLIPKMGRSPKFQAPVLSLLTLCRPLMVLESFSEEIIRLWINDFIAVFSWDKVIASLLVDKREPLRELAIEMLANPPEGEPLSTGPKATAEFAKNTLKYFESFISGMEIAAGGWKSRQDEITPEPALPEPTKQQIKSQTKEQQEKKLLKRRAEQCDQLKKKLAKSEKHNERLKDRLEQVEKELKALTESYSELNATIPEKVEEQLQSVLYEWLKPLQELECVCRELDATEGNLEVRAEALIQRQHEIDRHSGNRRRLRDRIERLEDLKQEILDLQTVSISPLKNLESVGIELENEIKRLNEWLAVPVAESPLMKGIKARLGRADTPDELMDLKKLLADMEEAGFIVGDAVRQLYIYCHQRMNILLSQHIPEQKKRVALLDPICLILQALVDNLKMIWLLDGHNILFKLADFFGPFNVQGQPDSEARHRLSEILVKLTQNAPDCQVKLFFDGPDANEFQVAPNVKVIYSGGLGDQRADDAICKKLDFYSKTPTNHLFMVTTDDRKLRHRVSKHRSHLMWVNEFNILLALGDPKPD